MRRRGATEICALVRTLNVRQLYPADELVDLLAVGGVPGLRQGGEGAGLHVLLAGLFVLALKMEGIPFRNWCTGVYLKLGLSVD